MKQLSRSRHRLSDGRVCEIVQLESIQQPKGDQSCGYYALFNARHLYSTALAGNSSFGCCCCKEKESNGLFCKEEDQRYSKKEYTLFKDSMLFKLRTCLATKRERGGVESYPWTEHDIGTGVLERAYLEELMSLLPKQHDKVRHNQTAVMENKRLSHNLGIGRYSLNNAQDEHESWWQALVWLTDFGQGTLATNHPPLNTLDSLETALSGLSSCCSSSSSSLNSEEGFCASREDPTSPFFCSKKRDSESHSFPSQGILSCCAGQDSNCQAPADNIEDSAAKEAATITPYLMLATTVAEAAMMPPKCQQQKTDYCPLPLNCCKCPRPIVFLVGATIHYYAVCVQHLPGPGPGLGASLRVFIMDSQNTLLPLPVAGQVLSRPGGSRLGQGFNINIARISVRTLEFQSWLERGWDIDTMRKLAIDSWQGLDILVELICGKHFKGRSVVAQVLGLNFGTFLGQCPPPPLLGVAAATGQLQQQSAAAETPSPGGQQCLFPAAARQRSLIADLGGGNRDQHSTRLVLNEEGVLKWYSQLLQFLQEFHPLPVLRQTVLKVLTTRHVDLRAALALEKPLLAHHGATGGGGSSFSSRKECAHPWIYECTQLLRGLASVKDIITTSFSSLSSKSTLQKDRSSRKGKMTASATNEETQQLKTPPLLVLPDHDVNFHNELTKLLSAIHQVLAIEYVRSKVLI